MKISLSLYFFFLILLGSDAFLPSSIGVSKLPSRHHRHSAPLRTQAQPDSTDVEYIKAELEKYLQVREESGADELAKQEIGKKIGGTKGNAILEYVSLSPNKESVVETPSNVFDYDELNKYGFGHLVTPIMNAGGRFVVYEWFGMEPPPITSKPKPVSAPKLVIDREGKNDPARYSGLKLGQVLDDELQSKVLEDVQRKISQGERLRPKLLEEEYVPPFADKRNVSPKQTPDWTPEKLDEWGKQRGKAIAWARRARDGEFVKDPNETLDLELQQRAYSILTALLVSTAFGKSTPTFLTDFLKVAQDDTTLQTIQQVLEVPAAALLLASVGSSILCAVQASGKNRNQVVWGIKGLLGGPLTVGQLRSLNPLQTRSQANNDE